MMMVITRASHVTLGFLLMWMVLPWCATSAHGLDPDRKISQYGHTAWRIQDGSVSPADPITQTADGYIWLGTSDGLMRFDGVSFVPWAPPNGAAFPSRNFNELLGARDGSLWIATSGGLSRLKDGHFQNYTRPEEKSGIFGILEDHTGAIWVTRYKVPPGEGPLCKVAESGLQCFGKEEGISAQFGLGLTEDSTGNIWFGSNVLCRWRPGSATTIFFDDAVHGRAVGDGVEDVKAGPDGTVWAAIDSVGPQFGVREFKHGQWRALSVPGFDGPSIRAYTLLVDRDGSLWVGARSGLYRVHNGIADHYGIADGLTGNGVQSLFQDREGNVWVVTDGGVDMFRNIPVITYSTREGLTSTNIRSIVASRDGSVWLANEGAADVIRGDANHPLLAGRGLPGHDVASLFQDHEGTWWLGVDHKLLVYQGGQFQEIKEPNGRPLQGQGTVVAVVEDASNNIWALSNFRLFRITGRRVEQSIDLGGARNVGYLAVDPRGGVWFTSDRTRLIHYRDGQFENIPLPPNESPVRIYGLVVDADDSLLAPSNSGLFRLNEAGWTVLDSRNGLPCQQIFSVIRDRSGSLWLYANCGLLRIEASELAKWHQKPESKVNVKTLDARDGAHPGIQSLAQPSSARSPDGRLWFTNGAIVQSVDPDRLYNNPVPPSLHIEDIIADRQKYSPENRLRLPALTRDLEIDYTATSFTVPQKVGFKYILEGHDSEWQDAGTRRQAFYSDLKPGDYHFRVIASNNDGVWNETGDSLDFSVLPAFYQTIWFRFLCGCFLLLLSLWVYRRHVRHLHRQFEIGVEARVAERTRIARDLHDTLLQSFHGCLLHFQTASNLLPERAESAKKKLDDAIEHASDAIAEARGAVEGLRSPMLVNSDLGIAVRTLGESLADADSEQAPPSLEVTVEGEAKKLDPMVRDEVYRIVAEALRNAYRHAKAGRIEVDIRYGARTLRVRIRDDGRGIEAAEQAERPGHYGLHGIRERAKLMGGNLEVWSDVNSGTEIEVTVPAAVAYDKGHSRNPSLKKGA